MQYAKPILVIMAAGMGSRFGGLKQIESITSQGEKIIDFSLYDAIRAGFARVIFIIKHEFEDAFKQAIGDRLAPFISVEYAFQRQDDLPEGIAPPEGRVKPYGTGHAILAARHLIDAPFAVINADDYYGPTAFRLVYAHLCALAAGQTRHDVMIAYQLGRTVSLHGHVSRGICELDAQDDLASIVERTRIEQHDGQLAYTLDEGLTWQPLAADTKVSMNFWGFAPAFLASLAADFAVFCRTALIENPLKAEFYLNAVVNANIDRKLSQIKVLTTPDSWHGVTYPEDKGPVVQAFTDMKTAGLYPQRLWPETDTNEVHRR